MVQISLQNSGGKVVFLPPWTPTGVKVPWSLLSVNSNCIGKLEERH